jgi:hypothetical protein
MIDDIRRPVLWLIAPMMLVLMVATVSNSRSTDPPDWKYPQSYQTGVPSSAEIHYGTHKTFRWVDQDIWAREQWEWSPRDRASGKYSHDSACGHVNKWKYAEDPQHPYEAAAYENFSDEHDFSNLAEADAFVSQWCKP